MHIVYSIAARFTFFFFKETVSYTAPAFSFLHECPLFQKDEYRGWWALCEVRFITLFYIGIVPWGNSLQTQHKVLKKPTFYHSDVWSDLTAPIVKHLDQVITSFIAKGPCTHLSILVP